MTETRTAGQELTAELRRYFSVGPRTRRYRKYTDLHTQMIEAIMLAAQYPGYYCEGMQTALRAGFGTALAYEKHVQGYRISGTLAQRINAMTAYQFAALLGQMVDAGVETTGAGERFFERLALGWNHLNDYERGYVDSGTTGSTATLPKRKEAP
jgi:hypothetical protein